MCSSLPVEAVWHGELFDGTTWNFTIRLLAVHRPLDWYLPLQTPALSTWVGTRPWPRGGDGLPKVSRSGDGGLTWETYTLDADMASYPKTLAVHPTDPETLFWGDNSSGVLRSQDHGQTWVPVNMGLNGIVVNDVAVDANDTAHLIAATSGGVYRTHRLHLAAPVEHNADSVRFVPGSSSAFYAGLWGDLARTQNGGTTWTFSSKIANGWIEDIAIDSVDSGTLFFADSSHVRRSTDGGDTFVPVLEGLNLAGQNYIMNTLAFDPADNNHIYAGGGNFTSPRVLGDLWESMDGGDTWRRTGLTDVIVNKVAVDPANTSRLYAGCGYSDNIDTPLYKSTDAGATWTPTENGLPTKHILLKEVWAESTTSVYAGGGNLSVLNFDGSVVEEILSGGTQQDTNLESIFGIDSNHIYTAGANGTILFFDGSTWTPMQSGTTSYLYNIWGISSRDLFAVGVDGTILHYDGNTWRAMASGTNATLYKVHGTSSDNVYAVGEGGAILHFNGSAWSPMPNPTTNQLNEVWAVSADAVFAGGADGTLLFYDGHAWSPMNSGTTDYINGIWGRAADDVYAVVDHKGQILHFDGTVWSVSTIPDATVLNDIWGLSNGVLFVVDGNGGMYRFDGDQWEALRPPGSRFRSVTDLAFNRHNPDILYASTYQAGVYISPDRAGQWLNLGTPVLSVNAISAGSLYAATSGGLYQLTGTGVLAGDVYDRHNGAILDDAQVTTDLGIQSRTIDGLYMMVAPAGNYDMYATADNYGMAATKDVTVFGADVTWVDFQMDYGVSGPFIATNRSGSTGSGSYCFVQTVTEASIAMDGLLWLCLFVAGALGALVILTRRPKVFLMVCLSAFFLLVYSGPAQSFTIFEQVGLASAPLPVGSGARAQGMGGAFIAVADDATAASWNPAGLIQVEKPEISLVGAYVDRNEEFSSDISPEINNTGDVSYSDINYASATLPFHWHKNLVLSLNYQHLFDFKREFQYQRQLSAPGVDLNQQIHYDQDGFVGAIGIAGAIEITPRVSLGVTVNVWTDELGSKNGWTENYSEVAVGRQSGVPVTINTTIQDDYEQFRGINFNLGLLWDTGQWGTVGVVVKTPFTATIQHRFNFNQTTTFGNPINSGNAIGPITVEEEVELDMPISYGLGWSRRFRDIFTLGIDIYRTEWGDYTLTNGQGEEFSPIDGRPKGQSDVDATTHIRVGGEYLFLMPQPTWRFRYGPDCSMIRSPTKVLPMMSLDSH